jgi:hemolysin activation/secretion protein
VCVGALVLAIRVGDWNMRILGSIGVGLLVFGATLLARADQGDLPEFRMQEYEGIREIRALDFKTPEEIDVPRVSERLYGEEDLERLPVNNIVIEGVVPYPERNITQEEIQAIIDQEFFTQQNLNLDENGFTQRDLKDIGRFLRDILDRGVEPDETDAQALIQLIQRSEIQRGWITIEQLDAIALTVTEHYRENGFILATAFIPEQEVDAEIGTIRLNVLEGRLGDVTVSNNQVFTESTIAAAFDKELGEPVTDERIEGALRRINDLPGVRVRGSFSPGENVGETRLNLGVLEEKGWTSSILFDNHGSDTTGANRLFATTEWLNIAHRGHRLVGGVLKSEGPDSSTYGLIEYEIPITDDWRGRLRGTISSNQFSVTRLANLPEIVGETNNFGLSASYQFLRSRTLNLKGQLGYVQKDVLFKVGELTTLSSDEKIEVVSVAGNYTQLWDEKQFLMTGRFGVDQGHMISGEARGQSTDFTKLLLNANLLKRFSIDNWLTKNTSFFNLVFKLNAQYAEKFLSSVEQFSLGGPNAVRAFGVSDVSVDSGAYAGFEIFFDLPFDPMAAFRIPFDQPKPFFFFDYGYGVARGASGLRDQDAVVKGFGLGFRADWPGKATANFVFAKPKSARFQDDFLEVEGGSRVYLDIRYFLR